MYALASVCVCACVRAWVYAHTHTHTHILARTPGLLGDLKYADCIYCRGVRSLPPKKNREFWISYLVVRHPTFVAVSSESSLIGMIQPELNRSVLKLLVSNRNTRNYLIICKIFEATIVYKRLFITWNPTKNGILGLTQLHSVVSFLFWSAKQSEGTPSLLLLQQ